MEGILMCGILGASTMDSSTDTVVQNTTAATGAAVALVAAVSAVGSIADAESAGPTHETMAHDAIKQKFSNRRLCADIESDAEQVVRLVP